MLICIEGSDASGKETQSTLLFDYLNIKFNKVRKISFPDYGNDSSTLAKMYLNGDFGKDPYDINPKATSIFFACDRYASFKTDWEKNFLENYIIVADRYTTSNAIHQGSKIDDKEELNIFIDWLFDLEYNIFKIPKPDITFFLNMPYEYSAKLMKNRNNKMSGNSIKDIHESDLEYLKKSYYNALFISKQLGWINIDCVDDCGNIKSKNDIHNEIIKVLDGRYGL